ncbi:MAG: sulfite exporter TauE/SafE family protein [Candidatus Poribacteria bacterium]|nr:sulfite exporter TauE/SafE family protein [Candidatus Poribacteria bacterium]
MGIEIFNLDLLYIILLMTVGMFAGFLNTVAFGGSLLTLPTLVYMLPFAIDITSLPQGTDETNIANGTNRVAIIFQNFSAILGFRSKGVSDFRHAIALTIPAVVGASIGAYTATITPYTVFKPILAIVMVTMLLLTLFNPTEWLQGKLNPSGAQHKIITYAALFIVGIYGGFIQAGVGLLVIATLRIIDGGDFVITNAHKVFIIFFYTIIALGIFISKGHVNWVLGLTLAVGNATGAWIGSNLAVKMGDKWIKVVLIVAVIAYVIKLLWDTVQGVLIP